MIKMGFVRVMVLELVGAATKNSLISSSSSRTLMTRAAAAASYPHIINSHQPSSSSSLGSLSASWCLSQRRGAKVIGSEVRPGNIVQRKGRIYQVLKAQHTQQGRGGASIQVELRDVDTGNKVTERFCN